MAIKYYLQPNPITPDPNDQSARILTASVLDVEAIIKKMLQRGSTLTEADCRAALHVFFTVAIDEVANGNNLNLPLCNVRPSISGVFTSASDSYDSSRHTIKATLSAGNELFAAMLNATVEKTLQSVPSPVLVEYMDVNTHTINSKLTPGGIGSIQGEELKFNPANATEGIFFVNKADKKETKVSVIATRTEGKLMFSVPTLAKGQYNLVVRRGYGNSATIRTGDLTELLTVA